MAVIKAFADTNEVIVRKASKILYESLEFDREKDPDKRSSSLIDEFFENNVGQLYTERGSELYTKTGRVSYLI